MNVDDLKIIRAVFCGRSTVRTAAVTLERADGVQVAKKSWGAFPDMTPAPEPTPEETEVEA